MTWRNLYAGLLLITLSVMSIGCGGPPAEEAAAPVSEAEIEENREMGAVPNEGG